MARRRFARHAGLPCRTLWRLAGVPRRCIRQSQPPRCQPRHLAPRLAHPPLCRSGRGAQPRHVAHAGSALAPTANERRRARRRRIQHETVAHAPLATPFRCPRSPRRSRRHQVRCLDSGALRSPRPRFPAHLGIGRHRPGRTLARRLRRRRWQDPPARGSPWPKRTCRRARHPCLRAPRTRNPRHPCSRHNNLGPPHPARHGHLRRRPRRRAVQWHGHVAPRTAS